MKINSQLDIFRILKYIISSPPNLSRSVGVDTDHWPVFACAVKLRLKCSKKILENETGDAKQKIQ